MGTVLLIVSLLRTFFNHFTQENHIGFEAAAWYWHFVDGVGAKQIFDHLIFKGQIYNFDSIFESTLRNFISLFSQVLLLDKESFVVKVSNNHIFMKSFFIPTQQAPKFFIINFFFYCIKIKIYKIFCQFLINKKWVCNNQKFTDKIYGFLFMRTIGNSNILILETVAETRKYFSSMYGKKENESALKKNILIKRKNKLEEEYITFIKNDETLFQRAVSPKALKQAWIQLRKDFNIFRKDLNTKNYSEISDSWFENMSIQLLKNSFIFPIRKKFISSQNYNFKYVNIVTNFKVKIIEKALLNALEPQFEGYALLKKINTSEFFIKNNKFINNIKESIKPSVCFEKKITIIKPIFYTHNYGLRIKKSAHGCLNTIKYWRNNTIFFLSYDIQKKFNKFNRKRFKNIFNSYIKDKRFWSTLNKMLFAGLEKELNIIVENQNIFQSFILSPLLLNIYLHELDKFIINLQANSKRIHKESINDLYGNLEANSNFKTIPQNFCISKWKKALTKYSTFKKVTQNQKQIFKISHNKYSRRKSLDRNIRQIQYVRYNGQLLIGIVGSKPFTIQIQKDINNFIKSNLHFNINKNCIVHCNDKNFQFLDYNIKLKQFKQKSNIYDKKICASKQHKKKSFIKFIETDRRLARAKVSQYKSNIFKQIKAICLSFKITAKQKNTSNISKIIAFREIGEQLMLALNITDLNQFFDLLMLTKTISSINSLNQALTRWTQRFKNESNGLIRLSGQIQSDIIAKNAYNAWEIKNQKCYVDQLKALQKLYIFKTQEIISKINNCKLNKQEKNKLFIEKSSQKFLNSKLSYKNSFNTNKSMICKKNDKKIYHRISLNAQIKVIVDRLRFAGFLHSKKNKASGNANLNFLSDCNIIKKYNFVIYGLLNWYSGAENFLQIKGLGLLLRKSCSLTLANKHKKSLNWVYNIFGHTIKVPVGPNNNISLITCHQISSFKKCFNLKLKQDPYLLWYQIYNLNKTLKV